MIDPFVLAYYSSVLKMAAVGLLDYMLSHPIAEDSNVYLTFLRKQICNNLHGRAMQWQAFLVQ
jgi:hypothetical protein